MRRYGLDLKKRTFKKHAFNWKYLSWILYLTSVEVVGICKILQLLSSLLQVLPVKNKKMNWMNGMWTQRKPRPLSCRNCVVFNTPNKSDLLCESTFIFKHWIQMNGRSLLGLWVRYRNWSQTNKQSYFY